jgi:threonine dehydratase
VDLLSPELDPPPITRFDIEEAALRILPYVRRTPVLWLGMGAAGPGELVLKLEQLQVTGSFKARGAFSRILAAEVGDAGVLAASGGNFGLAVAHAARALGHRAEIFVPDSSPEAKIQKIREEGAQVRLVPGYYAEAAAACEQRSLETGALLMHPYDQPEVVAGQGTIAAELDADVPGLTTVLVAVGGGGLIGGIGAWFGGGARVVGVEPGLCPTLSTAMAAGEPVDVEVGGIAADSLGARRAGLIGFEIARRFVERVVLVTDEDIVEAQRWLWRNARVVAEPGGAASLAALLSGQYRPRPDERVVALICGANSEPGSVA